MSYEDLVKKAEDMLAFQPGINVKAQYAKYYQTIFGKDWIVKYIKLVSQFFQFFQKFCLQIIIAFIFFGFLPVGFAELFGIVFVAEFFVAKLFAG